jgi:hypothetical protein
MIFRRAWRCFFITSFISQFLELRRFGRQRSGRLPLFGDLAAHRSNGEGQSDAILLWYGIVSEPIQQHVTSSVSGKEFAGLRISPADAHKFCRPIIMAWRRCRRNCNNPL